MVSLFTSFVARGLQAPAIDVRIEGHVDVPLVVDLSDNGPAAPAEGSVVDGASEGILTSPSTTESREVMASDGEDPAL